jgi:hypothetical protein
LATFPNVPFLIEGASLLGTAAQFAGTALVYLDGIAWQGEGGTLHVWRDGVDTIIADGVADFRVVGSPSTLYYTETGKTSGFGPWLSGTIHQVSLP